MVKPLAGHRVVSSISFALLFIAFLLLLLVSLSLPIIKSIYILSVKSTTTGQPRTSIATELRFGVWGLCASRLASLLCNYNTLTTQTSVLEQLNGTICFGPKLGYDIPPSVTDLAGISPTLAQAVEKGLLVILVLHPIAGGLATLGFIWSLFLASHPAAIFSLFIAIVTAIVASVVFAIDLALVIVARNEISSLPAFHLAVDWGNAVWMVLVAVVMTWLAVISLSARVCYCCGVRR